MGKHNIWSGQEDNILKDNYGKLKYKDIQSLIFKHTKVRRSIGAIRARVQILGIANKQGTWTDEQISYLIDNYKNKTYEEIGCKLNKSSDAVYHQVKKMNLSKKERWDISEKENLEKNNVFSSKRSYGANHAMKNRLKSCKS